MNHMMQEKKLKAENFLTPRKEALKINGKLLYNEGDQSWNMIRLKKEVLYEFPQLKEKQSSFSYLMVIGKTQEEIKQVLSEVNKEAVPVLLFFNKEKD